MKIGIDARMYGPRQAGLGRYIEQLIKELQKIDNHNQYVIFLHKENFDQLQITNPNFKKVLADIKWYSWQEQAEFTRIISKQKVDLIHFCHWNVPLLYNRPFIVTIHDLIMYHYPRAEASTHGPFVYRLKDKAHRVILKSAAKKAKYIITPSAFSKQDISQTLKIDPNKILVTPLASTPPQRSIPDSATLSIFQRHNIDTPYVLYVGNAYPHKNLKFLLQSWKKFNTKQDKKYKLVLVGKENFFYKKIQKLVIAKNIANVIFTGYLNDQELQLMYKNAETYVFPSLYEGFGLPPLEAMQYNIPVISSSASCLPEILGDAVLYFDPNDIDGLVSTLHIALNDQNMRQKLINNSIKILNQYSWSKTALQTLEIYEKTA